MVKTPRHPLSSRPDPQGERAGGAPFPVVGIGASAGGLEALEEFFRHLAPDSGMAFVVIQHLDPDHQDLMPELLQRSTPMPVVQAGDGMGLEPNRVYVIPPNRYLSLLDGTLYLLEPTEPRGQRLPIDFFFRALADEGHERAVGVILSGMGSDGTLGLRAIKEQAGLVLVQEPRSARFDAMPRSAIDAGLADIVAAAGELPASIAAYAQHLRADGRPRRLEPKGAAEAGSLEKIFILLRNHTGHDFSLYKKSTVYRRIDRRMGIHQIDKIADYLGYVTDNPQELNLLFKELLIGVTTFFRDPEAWACLQEKALPELLAAAPAAGKVLRAWVAGCSTGEEAFSLAMAFRETLEQMKPRGRFSLQIFATDLDPDAIERARQGFYPADIAADVAPERLARFFVEEGSGYRVSKEIREMVVFAPQNVIMDPPFTKLDILCCRNLLIYLGAELQKKLMPLFHYSLGPGGILFLGSAETVGTFTDLFAPIDGKARIFRRIGGPSLALDFPSRHLQMPVALPEESRERDSPANLQALADRLLLRHFAPAAVLVNRDGDVLYINGRTGRYLEPAAGKANWNIYAMARDGLREELEISLPRALRSGERFVSRQLRVGSDGGPPATVDLTIQPIDEPGLLQGMALLVFADVPPPPAQPASARRSPGRGSRAAELELALQQAREETQAIREEMQSSREELRSTNEELQSTNEELQSTNEELTTSKEEMQSLNEELQTVNVELQSKVDELSAANNDMKNLLNSTDLATVFLDGALCVRRFTTQATRIFKLIPGDVGRPLSDIVTDLIYPELHGDAREVLRTLVFCEKQVATTDGRWFMVKIMPYRTLQNVIDGVVITFTDITVLIRLEAELRHQADRADTAPDQGGS
ncbi:MAG TPA: chemotaxis protein CheB [Rhodocyclaceae bacterium]|nr:chemotaxis protein CheB [Rhodocyclaceae bacterium]